MENTMYPKTKESPSMGPSRVNRVSYVNAAILLLSKALARTEPIFKQTDSDRGGSNRFFKANLVSGRFSQASDPNGLGGDKKTYEG
jgi:hypothetical protein